MSNIRHHNEKPSATGLFTKGQIFVAEGQTSKMPWTTSGAGQIETNFGNQKRGCFDSENVCQLICSSVSMPALATNFSHTTRMVLSFARPLRGNLSPSRSIARYSQHGVVFCSQILFPSATVAFWTIFLSLADLRICPEQI